MACCGVEGDQVALTARGRMISNEVFERFLELEPSPAICPFIEKELYVDQPPCLFLRHCPMSRFRAR